MGLTKNELVEYVRMAEHNQEVAEEALNQQAENVKDWVPVVRCKKCKHWLHMEDGMGDCTNSRFHLPGHADPTMKADDFCSCGERRTE